MSTFTFGLVPIDVSEEPDSSPLQYVPNHEEFAESYYISYFQDKPRSISLLRSYISGVQNLEDVFWAVLTERWLTAQEGRGPAIGDQLEVLGRIIGRSRGLDSDAVFRTFIDARILANNSTGRVEELKDIVGTAGGFGYEDFVQTEYYPAHLKISFTGLAIIYITATMDLLRLAKTGGVRLSFVYSHRDNVDIFKTSSAMDTDDLDQDDGFGSIYSASTGGRMSGVFE
jgi:hypothetical protein